MYSTRVLVVQRPTSSESTRERRLAEGVSTSERFFALVHTVMCGRSVWMWHLLLRLFCILTPVQICGCNCTTLVEMGDRCQESKMVSVKNNYYYFYLYNSYIIYLYYCDLVSEYKKNITIVVLF